MTFQESIDICFKKYAQGKGRASRSEYWYFYLFTVLVGIGLTILLTMSNHSTMVQLVSDLINLALIVPGITVLVRRFHDTNRSAWNMLWAFLPIVGWIIILVYLIEPGTPGANNYGNENSL